MRASFAIAALVLAVNVACVACADEAGDLRKKLAAIESTLLGARDNYEQRVAAAQLCSDLAEPSKTPEKSDRRELAVKGIEHARAAVAKNPKGVEGHFLLAVCIGKALDNDEWVLGALSHVKEVEAEGKAAVALDEKYEHAAPHRLLAELYAEAPELASIGDWVKAQKHFARALELFPSCPENHLAFAKELDKHDDKLRAQLEAQRAANICAKQPVEGHSADDCAAIAKEAKELLAKLEKEKR